MRLTAVWALAIGAVLLAATPAQAHNYLVASTPAEGSTITDLPEAFSVTTNAPLLDLAGDGSGFALEVRDAAGRYYGDGCVSVQDATLSMGASLGEPGDYTLTWQLVSEDGHTVSGSFGFTWAGAATAEGTASPPDCGGTAVREPASTGAPGPRTDANLGDVLWIGGAIVAVLAAGGVTVLVLSRRRAR